MAETHARGHELTDHELMDEVVVRPRSRRRGHDEEPSREPLPTVYWLTPTVLTLALGLIGVGHRQPWEDEYASWWAATLSWSDLGHLLDNVDIVLAPYYVLLHLWISAFGDSAAALRIPSVLAMAGAAGLLVALGRRMFDKRVGLAAGLLFAVIPMVTRYAQEARPYAFAVLAALAATLLLLRALDRSSVARWAGYAVLVTCMGAVHLVTLTILAAHLALVLTTRGGGARRLLSWAGAAAVGLLPVLPLLVLGHAQSSQIAWIKGGQETLPGYPPDLFHSAVAAWAVIGLGLVGLLLVRRGGSGTAVVLLCWAALPPVLLAATQSVLNLFISRYLLFTLPAWSLLAAAGLCALLAKLPGFDTSSAAWRVPLAATLAAGALALGTLGDAGTVRANPLPGEPDWQAATAWMLKHVAPGDGMAFNGYREPRLALAYQLRHDPTPPHDVFAAQSAVSKGWFDPSNCQVPAVCAAGVTRIWLFSTTPQGHSFDQMPPAIRDLLAGHYRVKEAQDFAHVRVLLLIAR
ncbi:glycosyltransferase family 39 protein [Streptacidiphilus jiangxiensis]|uniref:Mannosyltransferase n=1 Tax=Streptacidiphilus jiangxiensis TaxID=235985 RepID=A0A1H7PZ15_STRJI|nr:glycosyltransferase family 39 protein [Streptacidiphilus jiangxiensis]SEL40708.1 mannosyltransferase [Streptacidiphilus jiangxiensis]